MEALGAKTAPTGISRTFTPLLREDRSVSRTPSWGTDFYPVLVSKALCCFNEVARPWPSTG